MYEIRLLNPTSTGRWPHVLFLHIIIGSVLYPWVNCTGIRTLNPGFRGSPLTHGYKTDPIMIHKRVTGVVGQPRVNPTIWVIAISCKGQAGTRLHHLLNPIYIYTHIYISSCLLPPAPVVRLPQSDGGRTYHTSYIYLYIYVHIYIYTSIYIYIYI